MRKIVMIDQDGVVCDKSYQTTKDIKDLVWNLIKKNICIVPNSDTPIQRLISNFQIMLGIAPAMVIGEKGAVVSVDGKYYYPKRVYGIDAWISDFTNLMRERGVKVHVGDSANWVREGKKFEVFSRIIIIDGQRKQTIALYIKQTDSEGRLHTFEKWSREVLSLLDKIGYPASLEKFDYNPKYGIAISNVKGIGKTDGYCCLKEFFPKEKFFMIGDQEMDIINREDVIHCSVANSVDSIKRRSAFVSNLPFTEGLEDCLLWITKI